MSRSKISIITASYNYAQYIEETIKSVLNQTYSDWELIIVDDGSADNSVEIIKKYCEKNSRIKLFQHENGINKGLKETLLLGVEKSTGDWIAFLESDDSFKPNNLEKKVEIIEKFPEVKLVFNKINFLWDEQRRQNSEKDFEARQKRLAKKKFPRNMFYDFYLRNEVLTFSCVMVDKQALKSVDFNTPVNDSLDWWLWIQLAKKGDFYYINEKLVTWRLHSESYNTRVDQTPHNLSRQAYLKIFNETKSLKLLLFILISECILEIMRLQRSVKRRFLQVYNKASSILTSLHKQV